MVSVVVISRLETGLSALLKPSEQYQLTRLDAYRQSNYDSILTVELNIR